MGESRKLRICSLRAVTAVLSLLISRDEELLDAASPTSESRCEPSSFQNQQSYTDTLSLLRDSPFGSSGSRSARAITPHQRRARGLAQHLRGALDTRQRAHGLQPRRFLQGQLLGQQREEGQAVLCALLVLAAPTLHGGVRVQTSAIAAQLTRLEGEGREVRLMRVEGREERREGGGEGSGEGGGARGGSRQGEGGKG